MFLNNYYCILRNHTLTSLHQRLCIIYLCIVFATMKLVNGAQFLNISGLLFLSAALAAASAPAPTVVMVPLKSMYKSP